MKDNPYYNQEIRKYLKEKKSDWPKGMKIDYLYYTDRVVLRLYRSNFMMMDAADQVKASKELNEAMAWLNSRGHTAYIEDGDA